MKKILIQGLSLIFLTLPIWVKADYVEEIKSKEKSQAAQKIMKETKTEESLEQQRMEDTAISPSLEEGPSKNLSPISEEVKKIESKEFKFESEKNP